MVSISGGEPLMDPAFRDQVRSALRCGFQVNVVSNGTLIDRASAEWMTNHIGVTAISIDGPRHMHDALRAADGAYEKALAGLRALRSAGARVGVLHTARRESLAHLRELVCLARDEDVELVQIHPLERTGRGRRGFEKEAGADLASRSGLMVDILRRDFPAAVLQVDVVPREALEEAASRPPLPCILSHRLADVLDPLVVEDDGTVVPWTYGLDRRLALGNLKQHCLAELSASYRENGLHLALLHQRRVRDMILAGPKWPYVNWFEAIAGPAMRDSGSAQASAEEQSWPAHL